MKTKLLHYFFWITLGVLIPLQAMASEDKEYYGGEITLKLHSSKTVELNEIGYDLIYQYGIKNGHSWYSDNRNIMTVPREGRFSCDIYGSRLGETRLHYWCVYLRDNMYYDYKCYWDVKVVASSEEDEYEDYPETWTSEGNYSTSWYNKNKSEYELSSNKDFAGLAYLVNKGNSFEGKTVKLTKDISLEGHNWSSIGIEESKPFKGIFDGQGHVVSDIYVTDQKDDQVNYGLWGCVDGATVKNLTIKGNVVIIPYLTTNLDAQNIGGLVGLSKGTCNFDKCRSNMKITYSRNVKREGSVSSINMGGLVGEALTANISYCAHSGDLWCFQTPDEAYFNEVASNYIGGIVGWANSKTDIEFCENTASKISCRMPYSTKNTANVYLGGIIGCGGYSISYCRSITTSFSIVAEHERFKTADKLSIGGIQGQELSNGYIENSYAAIDFVWVRSVSGRYNPAKYYGIGPVIGLSNFSNADVTIDSNISLTEKHVGSYTTNEMKGNDFLEELNKYPVKNLGKAIWTPDEDSYPCIDETHSVIEIMLDGDVNGDGSVDVADISAIISHMAGETKFDKADVNGDGTVDVADISSVISIMAGTYKTDRKFYVVGSIQGWDSSKKTCLFTPGENNSQSYTTKWTGAWDLKIWDANSFGNWDVAWGCAVDGDNSSSGDLINSGAQAISAPSAEYYTFTIDLNTMTYTWTKLANQTPTEYARISLIGEFNYWSGDFELEQVTPHNWYGVFNQENDGQLKFRANHDWSVNWGCTWNVADSFNKIGINGGGDIFVPAGTYAVYLNDITGSMMFVVQ